MNLVVLAKVTCYTGSFSSFYSVTFHLCLFVTTGEPVHPYSTGFCMYSKALNFWNYYFVFNIHVVVV